MHTPVLFIRPTRMRSRKRSTCLQDGGRHHRARPTRSTASCAGTTASNAVRRLFEVKQRPLNKAIPVLIGDLTQLPLITPTPLPPCARIARASASGPARSRSSCLHATACPTRSPPAAKPSAYVCRTTTTCARSCGSPAPWRPRAPTAAANQEACSGSQAQEQSGRSRAAHSQ